MERVDGAPLSNLEKAVLKGWLDFIVEENTVGNSIFRTSDSTTFYPTSDGHFFKNEKEAIDHEMKYLTEGYNIDS